MTKVFTIIVTYNGEKWLEECLKCLLESTIKTSIIVIDNASSDNTLKILQPFKDEIHFIQNQSNTGFGQANNIGIEYAMEQGADFLFLLNQDAYVFPNTIELLIKALKENPDFGILSPLQLDISKATIEPIFHNFLRNNFEPEIIENFLDPKDGLNPGKPYAMRFVNAAAWMITRNCIKKTGLFHPVFFHYGEDNHYASRVQFHKLKIGILPSANVIHDCKTEIKNSHDLLIRQMKNVPLYTLLDLRKPFFIAYLLGLQKWQRTKKKLLKDPHEEDLQIISDQKKWFFGNIGNALKIRKETSQEWKK